MSLFENVKCPVCNREFAQGDDIVVCPECGTPHHRECYNYAGKCVNSGLHKTDFVFEREAAAAPKSENAQPKQTAGAFFPSVNASNNTEGDKTNDAPKPFMPFGAVPEFTNDYANSTETIDGERLGDVAATVRNNIPRFVKIFLNFEKKEKKLSWNWGAFFFGSFYYFYRKMYKYAVSLIALTAALFMGYEVLLLKFAPKAMAIIQEAASMATQNNVNDVNAKLLEMQNASDFSKVSMITNGFFAVVILIRICEALFADRLYKTTVLTLIKRVRTQLDEGASFTSPIMGMNEVNLSQEQMKVYYLSSKGGVSIFAPVIAFFTLQLLMNFL